MARTGDKVARLYFGGGIDLMLPPDIDLEDEEAVDEARDAALLAALADGTFTEAVEIADSDVGTLDASNHVRNA